MSAKRRKIDRYILKVLGNKKQDRLPAGIIKETLEYIMSKSELDRKIEDTSTNRIHYLHQINFVSNYGIGFFVSAKHHHRPPLINAETLAERDNPKEITEGEQEKTHFALGLGDLEAYLLLEKKQGGMTAGRFVNYLNNNMRQLKGTGQQIEYDIIVSQNFLSKLREMPRIFAAEIYTTSDLLTDTFLSDAVISSETREEIELTIKAKKGKSIKKKALEGLYKAFAAQQTKTIRRMRVLGKSDENDFLLLDTDRLVEAEYIEVELDANGQVTTSSITPKIRNMIRAMLE
ncbi:MAG: hypothetical protein M0Z61_15155 [Nitrospiraceae bacterium]|nr:hypothetical protein [Nitrospiraceae bacterium]